ncbi:mannose-6-phosphate isomerase [Entamoeba marina]
MTSGPQSFQRIQGRVQHYNWGCNNSCIVSSLCLAENPPYAEIWYGTHPRLPSFIYNTETPISPTLPFLLKFLSIENPLSLQIHPDAKTAKYLFEKDNVHYVDPNAKPEICIPLSRFHCFLGFVDDALLDVQMNTNPPLQKVLNYVKGDQAHELLLRSEQLSKNDLEKCITDMKTHIASLQKRSVSLSKHQQLFLRLSKKYGTDVGLLASFLLRYEIFEPYHAFFIPPNYPHGYIEGECVEAMIASDNVIRFGLTPKFCDIEALSLIPYSTSYKLSEVEKETFVIRSDDAQVAQSIRYPNPSDYANDFNVTIYQINKGYSVDVSISTIGLFVIYKGKAEIAGDTCEVGTAFYIKEKSVMSITAVEDLSCVLLR